MILEAKTLTHVGKRCFDSLAGRTASAALSTWRGFGKQADPRSIGLRPVFQPIIATKAAIAQDGFGRRDAAAGHGGNPLYGWLHLGWCTWVSSGSRTPGTPA